MENSTGDVFATFAISIYALPVMITLINGAQENISRVSFRYRLLDV